MNRTNIFHVAKRRTQVFLNIHKDKTIITLQDLKKLCINNIDTKENIVFK